MTILKTSLSALALVSVAAVANAGTVDTIDASSGQADTYFVPSQGLETTSPYYRNQSGDWGWTHNAVADALTATSVELDISAYDVDAAPCGAQDDADCEFDEIFGWDTDTSMWLSLGFLEGSTNTFSFTTFDLSTLHGGALLNEVAAGLELWMDIDANDTGSWLVSLAKSVITTDGEDPGNPNPVPLPAAGWMLVAGLGGLGLMGRRKS